MVNSDDDAAADDDDDDDYDDDDENEVVVILPLRSSRSFRSNWRNSETRLGVENGERPWNTLENSVQLGKLGFR